jgi:hypothetical protein
MCVKYVHVYTERIWQENPCFREDAAAMGPTRSAQSAPNTHHRRYYTAADLEAILPQATQAGRKTGVYCRVSSVAQKPDLENQQRLLSAYCTARGLAVDE